MSRSRDYRSGKFMNFGFSTILLAFVMTSLVIFAALSYMTVAADYRLTKKTAQKNQSYYEAEEKAYDRLALLDDELEKLYAECAGEAEFRSRLAELADSCGAEMTEEEGRNYLIYSEAVNEKQELTVKLEVLYPQQKGQTYMRVLSWKLISSGEESGLVTFTD